MKKKSRFKVLSGVGKRWKVKYFDQYTTASNYWSSFMKLKGSGFAIIFDFQTKEYNSMTIKNGNPVSTGWKLFKGVKPINNGWY